ncbi:hypothetical protein ALQ24_102673 [Pseudomonas syringae pv. antirrhini]|nr:hypothetical protein ALQ23_102369 [Pseudomonas syringae pv. antirrhini]RMP41235.1 hypothetical protein ALQ24_102673 [Pseudomonas syringae pv. antirrhini]
MNRRHAAQCREAQVQRLPGRGSQRRYQGHRNVGGIGNEPNPVQAIQFSRLGGNVGAREVQAAVAGQGAGKCLGNDLAMTLGLEPVNHDPVVTGERLNLVHADIEQRLQGCGGLQVAQYTSDDSGLVLSGFDKGLQLDNQYIPGTAQRRIVIHGPHRQSYRIAVGHRRLAVRLIDEH